MNFIGGCVFIDIIVEILSVYLKETSKMFRNKIEKNKNNKKMSAAMSFIILFGIVSLFSDMTHEGASSIRGTYLSLIGASAGTIGFVSWLENWNGWTEIKLSSYAIIDN